jgi:hypothetical protein
LHVESENFQKNKTIFLSTYQFVIHIGCLFILYQDSYPDKLLAGVDIQGGVRNKLSFWY